MKYYKKLIIGFLTAALISLSVPKEVFAITYNVTFIVVNQSSSGTGGTMSPSGNFVTINSSGNVATVNSGDTLTITATPDQGYYFANLTSNSCNTTATTISGDYASGVTFTVGPVTHNCGVMVTFNPRTSYLINATAGTGGTISPSGTLSVSPGGTQVFTLTPNAGYPNEAYYISSVTGCGGTLSGNTYTIGPINTDCTVSATFALNPTASTPFFITSWSRSGGVITPAGTFAVGSGSNNIFTVTPDAGFSIYSVTGCGGTLSGNTYTTGQINAHCSVFAAFSSNPSITIQGVAGSGGSISPAGLTYVYSGATKTFNLYPNTGYTVSSVTGCGGTLSGNTYTTGPITAPCVVTASFAQTPYTVTASAGTGGTISPSGTVTVTSGATQAFTVAANTGYTIASVTGCSGTLSGSTYTTGSITANCTVTAAFTPTSTTAYSITASSGTGGTISPTGEVKVNSGTTKVFTVTPDAGYNIVSVTGCGGTLSDNAYTTGTINSDCMVTATFSKTLTKDNCIAVLYKLNGDYYISSQILNYKDISAKTNYYWTDFVYVPTTDGELWFKLRFAGELTDITAYSACQPALLSSDLNLYMPKLIINDQSYWIDIKYAPGTGSDLMFKLLLYGLN